MSLQHSDARRDRMREAMAADLPPPSSGAVNRVLTKHTAKAQRRAAARRIADELAEARALGVAVVVKAAVDRMWSEAEDAVVKALYPDVTRAHQRLPHRSRGAIKHRAAVLDVLPDLKRWNPSEVATLKRLWAAASPAEMAAALPRWSKSAIDHKARRLGLKGRGRPPLLLTGDPLCDAIRDRCRVLGYSMAYLDRIATSGTYFQGSEWNGAGGHRPTPMIRAVRALGGVLGVEWPD